MSSYRPTHKKTAKSSKPVEPPVPPKPKPNIKITVINADFVANVEEGGTKMDPYMKIRYLTED
jgi:hypothetical protein